MGFFSKKNCSICNKKIGLLGNRKLNDGNMCKDCAKKLSPHFSDRRQSTVAEIEEQLAYREENKRAVEIFNVTRTFDAAYSNIYVDEGAGKFVVANRTSQWRKDNPDVIGFSQVTNCNMDVIEDVSEIRYRDKEGKQRSYNPPRHKFSYNFFLNITVRSPYFDNISVKMNDRPIEQRNSRDYSIVERQVLELQDILMGRRQQNRYDQGRGQYDRRDQGRDPYDRHDSGRDQYDRRDQGRDQYDRHDQGRDQYDRHDQGRGQYDERGEMPPRNEGAGVPPSAAGFCPVCGAARTPGYQGPCEYCGK